MHARSETQLGGDEGYICQIEDLGSMVQGHRPQLRGRSQDVNKASAIARGNLWAIGDTKEIRVSICSESTVELLARGNGNWKERVSSLENDERECLNK